MPSSVKSASGRPLAEVPFAFLDTETTGLSPRTGGRVCEVAVISVQGGREVGRYATLLNPECPISYGAMMVHGITEEMVEQEPTFAEVADEVSRHLEGKVLVAHNAPFDVSFMQAEFARIGRTMPAAPVLCTLKLARRHFKFPSNSLGNIAAALGIASAGAHRAQADAAVLSGIFAHFLGEFDKRGVRTLEELLKL
ncbi:MAG: 3'-5' exonuclease [Elusimicrobia bacterium]|nr:3'-5' exonuclease [Elusimicrobiota bacterium]